MKRRRAVKPVVLGLEARALLASWSVSGAGVGSPPEVRVFNPSGIEVNRFLAFGASFRGGVQVAIGDVSGDSTPELIAATGPGGGKVGGEVRVFNGVTGTRLDGPLGDFHPFSRSYRGGIYVATADVNRDGSSDIIVGAGKGHAPEVKVYSGANGAVLADFLAFSASFRGGVRVAAGNFQIGKAAEIVAAAGPGSAPLVKVFAPSTHQVLARYTAFAPSFPGGVFVAAGDANGDGADDVVVGQGPGGQSLVRAFSGTTTRVVASAVVRGPGGVQVGVSDANGDGREDIYAYAQSRRNQSIVVVDGATSKPLESFKGTDLVRGRGGSISAISRAGVPSAAGAGDEKLGALEEYPLLDRLAQFDSNAGSFVPVGSPITNSTATAKNVYVIAHGWMPGYLDWVQSLQTTTNLPVSWQTWQGPGPLPEVGPSTPWIFAGIRTTDPIFDASTVGLAEQILAVDPNATVLAYSWIDDSATTTFADIPEDVYHSEAYTVMNGMRMAAAVTQALDPNYYQGLGKVDLIGHSHGARVATVAAVALQQAGAKNPQDNVVGQLTLLDSPEDDNADNPELNPVEIDGANFDWSYLSQLNIARTVTLQSTTALDSATVGVPDPRQTANLVAGMGVSGDNIPAGTTILQVNSSSQITLSAEATGSGATDLTFTPAPGSLFVNSYVSYFGSSYNNFIVNDPDQGITNQALTNVVDVRLNPLPFSSLDTNVIAREHEYAAAWFAGSQYTQNLPASQQVGLFWSPLVPEPQTNLQNSYAQTWSSTLNQSTQFVLAAQPMPAPIQPVFAPISLTDASVTGDVQTTTNSDGVTGLQLSDDQGDAAFSGQLYKQADTIVGFSFDYDFSQVGAGAQLQIFLNGNLYFAMTGTVANSSDLPGSGKFSATFGLGAEYSGSLFGEQDIQIVLNKPTGTSGSTTVTVNNFHTFTL
jgi:pimeloyl-ACP methyl ester carboxylesterase